MNHTPRRAMWALLGLSAITAANASAAPSSVDPNAFVGKYCIGCHNQKVKTGGISLQGLDATSPAKDAEVWEKVLRKVASNEMPPPGLPHPDTATASTFSGNLRQDLDRIAREHPNPGRPAVHRLNRAEYSNAIRDLLALDIKIGATLPPDDTGYGFDNIGDVLSMSPILLERYLSAARQVSRLAVGNTQVKPETADYVQPRGVSRTERVSDDLPFDSAGGAAIRHTFPVDAEYVIRVRVAGRPVPQSDIPATPQIVELRLPVKAGTHTVGATFLRESALPEIIAAPSLRGRNNQQVPPLFANRVNTPVELDLRLDGARLKLAEVPSRQIDKVSIAGPYNIIGPGTTPSRQKLFLCQPVAKEEDPCAARILSSVARRAYRRPVTTEDLKPLMSFYQSGRQEGGFDQGIEKALRAILISPNFLFRVERDPAGAAPGSVYKLTDVELASRLSFFLWSSIPDDELLTLAEQGKLAQPAVMESQVRRMLDDPKSKALVSNFAGQWLYLRGLEGARPDPEVFPKFDTGLQQAFQRETELFFAAVLRENRPVADLLDADFTFINQRLAEHYGTEGIHGSQFRRVAITDPNRAGILGQGSILTVTSYPNRTSVVQRGKWVLENLLGTPPPPPPPDIPALPEHGKEGAMMTMREQMELHRSNPTCAACHSRMDPIGFALENYDAVGSWRSKDGGKPIDVSGKLPDGTTFSGPAGLRKLLLSKYKDDFVATVTEKLMTYALGRGMEHYDQPAIRSILHDAAPQNYTLPALINSIVKSPQFQMRRTRES